MSHIYIDLSTFFSLFAKQMKIILAIDSFKGSLTSLEAEQAVAETIIQRFPQATVVCIPIADGGEGTLSVLLHVSRGNYQYLQAHNPCMEIIPTQYGISADKQTAYIEMATISGLPLLKEHQKNPMKTTTFGTGELIKDALEKGCTHFIIGIGGSATNDAGTGMLQALGYRFYDKAGKELGTGGEVIGKIARIESSNRHPLLANAHFTVACDVQNPFYGPQGAAHVFARQKGANDEMIERLDEGMKTFAQVIQQHTGKDISQLPGSGAAGGLGGCLAAFMNANLKSGAELLLQATGFYDCIANANLIITGEGKIDKQSLMGKITGKILEEGKQRGIPVIALTGLAEDIDLLKKAGFAGIHPITEAGFQPLKEAMKPAIAKRNLKITVSKIISNYLNCD